jgi:hypothetical protein
MGYDEEQASSKDLRIIYELKLLVFILAFFKSMFFVRIFESYGQLVQMIQLCLQDLAPFIFVFFTFEIFFTIAFTILNMEIDEEVAGAVGLSPM